jgi:hypothetical protein
VRDRLRFFLISSDHQLCIEPENQKGFYKITMDHALGATVPEFQVSTCSPFAPEPMVRDKVVNSPPCKVLAVVSPAARKGGKGKRKRKEKARRKLA